MDSIIYGCFGNTMLQPTSPFTTEPEAEQGNSPRELVYWAIGFLRRQFAIIFLIASLAITLGVLYLYLAPPIYTAEATVVVDPRRVQLFPKAPFSEGQMDTPALESEIELVKSEPVARSVINKLGLAKNPKFLEPQTLFGIVRSYASHLFSSAQSQPLSEPEIIEAAIGVLSKNLTVKRVGVSYNLVIQYRVGTPGQAAQIANAIAEAYIVEQLEGKYGSTKLATQWLQGRLDDLNKQQSAAERAVIDYKQQNKLITADGKLVNEQQMSELNTRIAAARTNTSQAKARLDRIDAIIRDESVDRKTNAAVTDTLSNPIITQLRSKYLELVNREAYWSRKYGPNHQAVVNVRNQIRDIRASILDELKRIRETYLSDYEIAKQQEQDLEKRLAEVVSQSQTINRAQVPLRDLESSAHASRTIYENFLQRYAKSLQQQAFPVSDARVLASASPPSSRSSPKTALVLLLAAAGGAIFGVGMGAVRELMSGSLRTRQQVESTLQLACISMVPFVEVSKLPPLRDIRLQALSSTQSLDERSSRTILCGRDVIWAVLNSPFSRFAEAICSIKLAVDLGSNSMGPGKVIGFTSPLPHEGKSTIAASLALLIAQAGARVILVDCDLRNPSLSTRLASKIELGILDVIVASVPLDNAIWREQSTNLEFLPASAKARNANSCDILAAGATQRFFEDLRSRYDYVIVDLAPLMPIVDTRATTRFVDAYICVTEWGATKIDAVKHAFQEAPNIYENLLGIVMNKVNIDQLSTYDPVGRNYYRNKYYAQYGVAD